MKFFNWLKRPTLPKSKAAAEAVADAVGITDTEEFSAIQNCFADCEVPPDELIIAGHRLYVSAKQTYINGLLHDAHQLRESIMTTTQIITGDDHD